MAKRNNFRRALKQLKSVEIEEKLNGLNEAPTNSMSGVYNLNPKGWHNDPPQPAKTFYPDAEGNWPDGFPANAGDKSYTRPAGWWDNDGDWTEVNDFDTTVESIGTDGKNTDGIITSDGYVKTPLPEGTRDFILGPLIDGFTYLHGYDAYTTIGYIQKDTRDFVLLGKIDGQWATDFHHTSSSIGVWDGTESGFTSYNEKFKLEHAQWFRDQILRNKYTFNVPYYKSGGTPQQRPWPPSGGWPSWIPEPLRNLLDNMFGGTVPGCGNGGNADDETATQPYGGGGHGPDKGDEWTPPGPYEKGDQEDAGGPWPDNPDAPSNRSDRSRSDTSDRSDTPKSRRRRNTEDRAVGHGLSSGRAAEMSDAELDRFVKLQDNLQADIERFSAEEKAARKEMREIAIGFGVDVALTLFGGAILKGGLKAASLGYKALKGKNILKASQVAAKANRARQQAQLNNLTKFGKTLKGSKKAEYLDDLADLQHFTKNQPNQSAVNKLYNKLNNPKNYGGKGGLLNAVDDVGAGTISQKGSKPFMHKTTGVKNIKTPPKVKNTRTGKMEFDVDIKNSKGETIAQRFKSPDDKWYEIPNPYKAKGSSNPIKNIGDKLKWEVGQRQVGSSQISKWKQTGEPLKGWRPDRLITDPFGPGSTFSGPTSGAAKVLGGAAVVGAGAAIIKGIERFGNSGGFNKIEKMLSPKAVNINDPDLKSTVQEIEKEIGKEAGEFVKNLVSKPAEELKSNMKKIRTDKKLIDPKRSDFPMGRSGAKQFAAAQKFSEVASPTSSVLTAGKVYLNYLIGNLPKIIDNKYLGDKFVNRAFKDASINNKGTITVGDAVIGSGGKMKFDSKTNEVVLPFNYDFDTNEQAIMKEPDKYDARKVIPAVGMVAAWIVGGKYGIDSVPIPGAGYATWLSKSLGIGAEHRPGEIRMSVQKLKANNKTLYDRLVINGTIKESNLVKGLVLTEGTRRQLREIKKPYEIREEPVQKLKKYRPNFKGKFKAQNTPDVTASRKSDELVASGNAKGQAWRIKDKNWSRYETQERMNVVFDKVGHGQQAWDLLVNENQRKNSWKNRQIQEQLNIIAAEKAERQLYPDYESPWGMVIHEQQTIDTDKDPAVKVKHPLVKDLAKRLKGQIDYPEKPAKKGYPNDPPPKMVDGWHPKLGKKYKYDKLDPVSAKAMPLQGNPEIDANIKKARQEPKIEPGKEPKKVPIPTPKVKKEQYSDWRSEEKIRKGLTNA